MKNSTQCCEVLTPHMRDRNPVAARHSPPLCAVHGGNAKRHVGATGATTRADTTTFSSRDDERRRRLRGIRTLIVEDEPTDQKIVLAAALQLGLRPRIVDNSADALEQLRCADGADYFDLVLIDYKLPGSDGLLTSQAIRAELALDHMPKILLLSAYDRSAIFGDARSDCHVDGFLTKPILPGRLSEALLDLADAADSSGPPWPDPFRNDDELLSRARVLLAEDNEINQRVAAGILQRRGVDVTVARNGQEAVDRLTQAPPDRFDLIIMDVDMPVMDGCDATRAIKQCSALAHIPVIALTAHNSANDRQRCIDCGMADYLTKPVKPQFLYDVLLRLLR